MKTPSELATKIVSLTLTAWSTTVPEEVTAAPSISLVIVISEDPVPEPAVPIPPAAELTLPVYDMCKRPCSDQTTSSDCIASSAPTCDKKPEIVLGPKTSASFSIRSGKYCCPHEFAVPVKSK